MTAQNTIMPSSTTTNIDGEAKTSSIVIADITNNNNNNKDILNDAKQVWPINDTLDLKKKEIIKLLEQENSQENSQESSESSSINSSSSVSSASFTTMNKASSSSSSSSNKNETLLSQTILEHENDHDDKVGNKENDQDIEMTDSPVDISPPSTILSQQQTSTITTSSPSSSLHKSSSLPTDSTLPDSPKVKNLPRRNRSVSFNKTVTFIPHVPPPPTKIRKKISREASIKQKDVIVEIEDLGKVRVDGKNGRIIKITPFVWPGPLSGDNNNDMDMNNGQTISSPRSSTSYDEEHDDDVLVITAVPVTGKDKKKLRIGKHFKRYYNKLIPHHNHKEEGGEEEGGEEEEEVQEQQQQV